MGPGSGFGRLLASLGFGVDGSEIASYLIGLGLIGAAIYALGLVVHSRLGAWGAALFDRVIRRIPLVSNLYDLSSRFVSIVDTKKGDSVKGMSPAWCYFGGKPGAAVLALLPIEDAGQPRRRRLSRRPHPLCPGAVRRRAGLRSGRVGRAGRRRHRRTDERVRLDGHHAAGGHQGGWPDARMIMRGPRLIR